jgi:hypothetical protein
MRSEIMSGSISRPVPQPQRFGRLWWLPPGGMGNGIEDEAWAPILEVSADHVAPLLAALRAAGVPAYAAAASPAPSRRTARAPTGPGYRLWVGASAYGRAEETLITVMRALTGLPHDQRF